MTNNSEFKIRREDPPAPTRAGGGNRNRILKQLTYFKKNPGVWYKVRENASSGAYMTYKKHGCETRTKTVGEGRYDVWARWPEKPDTK